MAFGHRVSAQQDVLKEAHSDILDRAGSFLSTGAGKFLNNFEELTTRTPSNASKGIIRASLPLEAGARSQAGEEEDEMQRWMEEELDDELQWGKFS